MKIGQIIKNILPYSIVNNIQKRKYTNYLDNVVFDGTYGSLEYIESKFNTVIALQGFGYSGHTAAIDLLREYSSICMPSDLDYDKIQGVYTKSASIEVDFVRLSGGLYEYEKFINGSNIFQNDAALQRMLKMLGSCKFLKLNDRCIELTKIFIDNLVDLQIPDLKFPRYNYHLQFEPNINSSILFAKQMEVDKYRKLVSNYLTSVWNSFYDGKKSFIIADHLFSDITISLDTREAYVPNLKTIVIYRDPRDVFASAYLYNEECIPHNDAKSFIKWWNHMFCNYEPENKKVLYVRFEELVAKYEETVKSIEEYLGLDPKDHIYKYQCLDPSKSIANIGIWQNLPCVEEVSKISERLTEFCFNI